MYNHLISLNPLMKNRSPPSVSIPTCRIVLCTNPLTIFPRSGTRKFHSFFHDWTIHVTTILINYIIPMIVIPVTHTSQISPELVIACELRTVTRCVAVIMINASLLEEWLIMVGYRHLPRAAVGNSWSVNVRCLTIFLVFFVGLGCFFGWWAHGRVEFVEPDCYLKGNYLKSL